MGAVIVLDWGWLRVNECRFLILVVISTDVETIFYSVQGWGDGNFSLK